MGDEVENFGQEKNDHDLSDPFALLHSHIRISSNVTKWASASASSSSSSTSSSSSSSLLPTETWTLVLLVCASVQVCVIGLFETFILLRVCLRSHKMHMATWMLVGSRRHFFLGQLLLLGLFLGSLTSLAYVCFDHKLGCLLIRLGTGTSYALIFSAMLVKLIFLFSLNTGVYLPAGYQALLAFFSVLVQVAIDTQWMATDTGHVCQVDTHAHLVSLVYVAFLVMLVSVLAARCRHYCDNYREAKYIALAMAIVAPGLLTLLSLVLVLDKHMHMPIMGFALLLCCSLLFLIMFVPRARQKSALGKEGLFAEDQVYEENFDSVDSDDVFPPSFRHFRSNNNNMYNGVKDNPFYLQTEATYAGFHRPLRVVPPTTTNTNASSSRRKPRPETLTTHLRVLPMHVNDSTVFPSHFFPAQLHQYWPYMQRPIGGYADVALIRAMDAKENAGRSSRANPNVYYLRSPLPHFVY